MRRTGGAVGSGGLVVHKPASNGRNATFETVCRFCRFNGSVMQSWVGGALPRIQGVAAVMGVTSRESCPDGRGVSPCRASVAR